MAFDLKYYRIYDDFLKVLSKHDEAISFGVFEHPLKITFSDGQKIANEIISYDDKLILVTITHSTIKQTKFTHEFLINGGFASIYRQKKNSEVYRLIREWSAVIIAFLGVVISVITFLVDRSSTIEATRQSVEQQKQIEVLKQKIEQVLHKQKQLTVHDSVQKKSDSLHLSQTN